MRYFQRIGPTVVLQEQGVETALLVAGPIPPDERGEGGAPGQMVQYPDDHHVAEQLAGDPGWIETDAAGQQLSVTRFRELVLEEPSSKPETEDTAADETEHDAVSSES
jgi:hypothetical protein